MAALAELYIKKETLKTLFDTLEKKGDKGISLTISVNDEVNDYGQNISSYVSQSKEQREAKKDRYYVGNGKVFWSDGKPPIVAKAHIPKQEYAQEENNSSDLPF